MLDYIRIACAVPAVKVGDVKKNTEDICAYMAKADAQNVDILVFPELAMTGYTCGDLFWQDTLWKAVKAGLQKIVEQAKAYPKLNVVVGLPVRYERKLYNCAAFIAGGKLVGMVPKTYLTQAESRWFSSSDEVREPVMGWDVLDFDIFGNYSFGAKGIFEIGDNTTVGVELGDDLFAPVPPSSLLCLNGAEVILNLAASNEIAGKRVQREERVRFQSAACKCIYAYASAGCSESTSDLVYSGHSLVAENGAMLAENSAYVDKDYMIVQDCDLGLIRAERMKDVSFRASTAQFADRYMMEYAGKQETLRSDGSLYPLQKLPFIPSTKAQRHTYCNEIFQLQVTGLKQRLTAIGGANAVIGISGGLDSTLALLVAVEAMRQLGRPTTDVYGVTMPCFGTSDRTYQNAWELMRKLGISCKEIVIKDAVSQHFSDIGHDPSVHNATYENAQARERTQILMDYASVVGGIVVGTGDLSELALGWCTYNGDHMSMYSVNGTVPKTLMRWMIDAISETESFAAAHDVLQDILDTPISPELLPPDATGKISQQTEDLVGPYALHDFFIYHILRYGFTPEKVYTMACRAFASDFDAATVKKWLKSFYRRFFTQQFKRNCMPDGPKVTAVGLGPRGDWNMPSDASARIWLEEAETL